MTEPDVSSTEVDSLYLVLKRDAEAAGYHLNPDLEFTQGLVSNLIVNERRYGYRACPCRLAAGDAWDDQDIVCPCDYRDPDLTDYGVCYCALYVSDAVLSGQRQVQSIPDRRPPPAERRKQAQRRSGVTRGLSMPVWRCRVCGYLCAREQPPDVCPICKAKRGRFERFLELAQ